MTITEVITRDDYPCARCGRIREVTGEFPDGELLCRECRGIFSCRCCRWPWSVCVGRRDEYIGDPADYVCYLCVDQCRPDDAGSDCERTGSQGADECRCPTSPGPIPRSCPQCGACNHINLPPFHELQEGDKLICGDCDREVTVTLSALMFVPGPLRVVRVDRS